MSRWANDNYGPDTRHAPNDRRHGDANVHQGGPRQKQQQQHRGGPPVQLWVFRVVHLTDVTLESFIRRQGIDVLDIQQISHKEAAYKSFVVTVKEADATTLLHKTFWPGLVSCKLWKDHPDGREAASFSRRSAGTRRAPMKDGVPEGEGGEGGRREGDGRIRDKQEQSKPQKRDEKVSHPTQKDSSRAIVNRKNAINQECTSSGVIMKTLCLALTSLAVVVTSADHLARIAGGDDAIKGQFPWVVSIEATNFQEGWPLCGGILYSSEWVLTAAHCLDSEKPEWLWVVSGEHNMDVDEGTEQKLLVDYFVTHPDYVYWEKPYKNDIALIHLSTPARLDTYTALAALPKTTADIFVGPCSEAGWGSTNEGEPGSAVLQWAEVSLLPIDMCQDAYSFTDINSLCAGVIEGGVGACVGDNGGGLEVWDMTNEQYIVGGIMSFREGCAEEGRPAVYMNIAAYLDWIDGVTSKV